MKFPSEIFECEQNERQSSEIPMGTFQVALTHSAVFFVITLQKLNLFILTCVFVVSEGYTANMQRSRSTFPYT